ncbi:uncharacterized protein EI90DRAFT_3155254 [Cantharellus anzutake]|uniref:uncharacterized protein n=1 Tax=Cantharellus anzutake TaxID=1750568 RepID=UPI0019073DD1|nr:uncharacterized protein EI90DRAFT_3294995 [Cantharellus anzutake]XP_038915186.1 uncharacterized protein EI90DRAFT_3155254 [Cantharellus anzutake]KAF8312045.1 hypothetical protein EI90DRAFT_3294995 [Cantharellus anzutake]KAF8329856.1 hypothetical protein EI90DRAFT_3155254 [Cantharellus anzutake]
MVFAALLQVLAYIGVISTAHSPLEINQALVLQPSIPRDNSPAVPPILPNEHWGYVNFHYEMDQPHPIDASEGRRINVKTLGGNWTNPNGSLLAKVLPGIGGDQGYIDKENVFRLDVRQAIEFVSDRKYGYVQLNGFGKVGGGNNVFITVETRSAANLKFNNRLLYALGVFTDAGVSATVWALGPPKHV